MGEVDELLAKMKNGKLEDYDKERLAKLLGIDEKDLEKTKVVHDVAVKGSSTPLKWTTKRPAVA